jgi:hypothetical protein
MHPGADRAASVSHPTACLEDHVCQNVLAILSGTAIIASAHPIWSFLMGCACVTMATQTKTESVLNAVVVEVPPPNVRAVISGMDSLAF